MTRSLCIHLIHLRLLAVVLGVAGFLPKVAHAAPPSSPYAWYRADAGLTTNVSGVISQWATQTATTSDLDRTFGTTTTLTVPRNGGGTAAVVSFNGTSSLWAFATNWGEISSDRTVVAYIRLDGAGSGFLFDGSTSSGLTRAQIRNGKWQVGVQSSGGFSNADPETGAITPQLWQTHIFQYDINGGSTFITHWIDGVQVGTHSVALTTNLGGFILGANGAASLNLDVDVAELLVYDRLLTSGERTTAETHMDTQWGDLNLALTYQSATVLQTSNTIPKFGIYGVAALEITSIGNTPSDSVTSLTYNLNGTTDASDIEEVRLYTSGSDSSFAPESATLLASTNSPSGTFSFNLPVATSQHYLWIAAKLRSTSSDGDIIDAEITEFTLTGAAAGTYVPTVTAPPEFLIVDINAIYSLVLRKEGDDGSGNFRIPGLVTTTNGTLVAAFDIRWDGNSNSSPDLPNNIDVGIMRSTDGGVSWLPMQIIMDYDETVPGSSGNGVGDPSILVDTVTGRIWCAALWSLGENGWAASGPGLDPADTGQFVLNYSDDDGATWSAPVSITSQIKDPAWNLYFQGPGKGICTREGTLIFPAQYRDAGGTPRSNFIYSTDRGTTWITAAPAIPSGSPWTTEAQIVELDSGDLLISMRNHDGRKKRLWCKYSWNHTTETIADGTWGTPWFEEYCPTVMGSVDRYRSTLDGHPWSGVLFANPDSQTAREKMSLRLSLDEGLTWAYKRKIDDRPAAYSCMTLLPDGDIGILYETGESSSIATLVFARFPLEWLVGTTDTDEDGISDFDEDRLGLDKNNPADAAQDPDNDGMNSGDEAHAQTLPNDGNSILRSSIGFQNGNIQLDWPTVPYVVYGLETSTNLLSGSWTPVPGAESITAGSTHITVEIPEGNEKAGYYRIAIP